MTEQFNPVKDTVNHTSAAKFPEEVKKFIMTELQQGALCGPIHSDEFANIHISPLMSRPKEGDARRIIVDLS
jgi:GGDEF domain-containing protein